MIDSVSVSERPTRWSVHGVLSTGSRPKKDKWRERAEGALNSPPLLSVRGAQRSLCPNRELGGSQGEKEGPNLHAQPVLGTRWTALSTWSWFACLACYQVSVMAGSCLGLR